MESNNETEATKKVFSKEQLQRMSDDALKSINDDQTIEVKKITKEDEAIVEEPTIDAEITSSEEINEDDKPLDKKGKKKMIIIIIIIVAIFLLLAGLFTGLFLYKKKHKKSNKKPDVIVKKDNYRYENGKLIFVDKGKELGTYQCKNKDTNSCYVANYNNDEDEFLIPQMVYEDGSIVVDTSDFINNQYAFIIDGKKDSIIIYDFKNNTEIERVNKIKYYNKDNYVVIAKDNKYALVNFTDEKMEYKINLMYDYIGVILGTENSDELVVLDGNNYRIVNFENKALSKNINSKIRNYNDKYIIAGENDKLYLYDYKDNLVFTKSFSFIKLLSDYVITVNGLDLNIFDYDSNKYNMDPIVLKNSNFVAKNVYDKNGKKIKTESSFEEAIKDNKMIITIKTDKADEEKKVIIDLLEGKVNKNLKYINYFDGTLYFYRDEEKTDLLGSYICTNKNTITAETTTLNNCFVAKDTIYENNDMESDTDKTVGVIPIINNTFVFISDSKPTDAKKTVKFYNLSSKKVLGGYQNVCTYLFSGQEDLTFADVNSINFIARNSSGKMGLIKINGTEVSTGIKFIYLSLEKMGKYYLAKNSDAKYMLIYDDTGVNTSLPFNGQIKGYNAKYIKVLENNKYVIYDFDNNKITTTGYKYIDLFSTDLYAAVDDSNNLKIFDYTNNSKLSEDVKLYSNKYTDSEKPSFKLSLSNKVLTIGVLKDEEYQEVYYDLETGLKVEG